MAVQYPPQTPNNYVSPQGAGIEFEFVSAYTIFPYRLVLGTYYYQKVLFNEDSTPLFENTYYSSGNGQNIGFTTNLKLGTYTVYYEFGMSTTTNTPYVSATYTFTVVENKFPLKPWTVTSVINRLLDLCEPIRKGEKPRFRLNGMDEDGSIIPEGQEGSGQAAKFDKITAPQFALTRQTLRECLQEVGKVIHGEPRLKIKKDSTGNFYYEVIYDLYASQEESNIFYKPYTTKGMEWVINNYQTTIDTNAENLINQLDKLGGVIVEPYANGGKTVRTENQYVRINEDNMLIATQYPIYTVEQLLYIYTDNGQTKAVDITPYVFEKSEYDTRLSSYQEQYPYSKAYALYFSQGSQNIGGLNFKVPSASSIVFKEYAITNILKQVLGSSYTLPAYPLLTFRVTYTPIYGARIAQTKTNYKDFKYPAALIYNQQSNVIETRYYGENLKGVAARLGNVEKSYTYCLKWLKNVPRAGMMFRQGYYISAVAVEILPTYIRATLGISKDFNRISAYIGVPSEKRYYEISEQQAVDRNVLYREYIVVGDQQAPDQTCLMGAAMLRLIEGTFRTSSLTGGAITNVYAWGTSYQGNQIPAVSLPVVSSAFGNSISFAWRYENNYSAGPISQKIDNTVQDGSNTITGYWQNDARYTDYYGRLYYYHFQLAFTGDEYTEEISLKLPQIPDSNVPQSSNFVITTLRNTPYIMRKDNREALQVNFQIDFVTNSDIIIGSALSSSCPAVRGSSLGTARLYVFPTELNKFTDHIEAWEEVDLKNMPYVEVDTEEGIGSGYFYVTASAFPASGKSWAIVTPQTEGDAEMVEDEQGDTDEYSKTTGGDLLIGRNQEVTAGQEFTPIYFTKKVGVTMFDYSAWVNIK